MNLGSYFDARLDSTRPPELPQERLALHPADSD